MNREELIKELRRAERYCLNEYSTMAKQAADLIESQQKEIERLKAKLGQMKTQCMTIRNELCMKCGGYHRQHMGACDGCRWRR